MTRKRFIQLSAVMGTTLATMLNPSAHGQSVDALLDKLVDKGILSTKEANDLKAESDKGFTTAYAVKSGMSDWVSALKFNGDFRGRYDGIYFDAPKTLGSSTIDRQRFRYRLRFGVTATLQDDFEIGFRLGSGEAASNSNGGTTGGGNPLSNNTTLSGDGTKKFLYVDTAFAKWTPLHQDGWNGSLKFGKMENPFVISDLVFDPDYTPEGMAGQISYAFNDRQTLSLTGGGFMLNEVKASSNDPYFFGAQIRLDSAWNTKLKSSVGVSAMDIVNKINLASSMVPDQNVGNTRVKVVTGPATSDFFLAYNYNPVVADAAVTYSLDSMPGYSGAFPVKLFGTFMDNPAAPANRNKGWETGVTLGKSGKKGLWDITYRYKSLKSDAWYEELVDDDFGAYYNTTGTAYGTTTGVGNGYGSGTNVRGHIVKATYSPYDSLTLGVNIALTELVNNPNPKIDSKTARIFVDALWKF